jgi:hypothetical protein
VTQTHTERHKDTEAHSHADTQIHCRACRKWQPIDASIRRTARTHRVRGRSEAAAAD